MHREAAACAADRTVVAVAGRIQDFAAARSHMTVGHILDLGWPDRWLAGRLHRTAVVAWVQPVAPIVPGRMPVLLPRLQETCRAPRLVSAATALSTETALST